MKRNVVKIRLYPTVKQRIALAKSFGCARWVWNNTLAEINRLYNDTGKGLNRNQMKARLVYLKKEHPWLATDIYSQVLQSVCLHLSQAFINFFEKRTQYPRFKSKRGKQSIQYPQHVKLLDKKLKLPKIGEVKAKFHLRLPKGRLKTVTISQTPCGHYYASVLFDEQGEYPTPSSEGKAVGIDLGIKHFAVTSDGSKYANPKHIAKHQRNLKRKQQKLSRKEKGSKSREKARRLVARVQERIVNSRKDFLHKLSHKLVNENQVIICENLNVKGMVKNHNLTKAISDCGWGMFTGMLKYKCERLGKVYLEVERFFPSSKTCCRCLYQVSELPLDIRAWTCPSCGTSHDRDINGAINIRNEGLRFLSVSGTGMSADGGNVRPKRGRKKSSVEAIPYEAKSGFGNL